MTGRAKNDLERSEMERNIHGQKVEDARCVEMNKMCLKAERMATDRRSYLLSEEENTFNNLQKVFTFVNVNIECVRLITILLFVFYRRKQNSQEKAMNWNKSINFPRLWRT